MKFLMSGIVIFVMMFFNVKAEVVESCFPKSSLRFSQNQKTLTGISEEEFAQLINRFEFVMSPLFKERTGKKLIIKNQWSEATVDASATRDEELNPTIIINGGIARHPLLTRDGLLLVLCHEAGHHLGGAPKSFRGKTTIRGWSSAEGEADYFATTKCLPRFFNEGFETKNLDLEIDNLNLKHAYTKCKDDVCARMVLAGKSLSDVFASLKVGSKSPSILDKDQSIVSQTIYNHPNAQCRLDTYVAGARCDVGIDLLFDNSDPRVGACVIGSVGARPDCWYREADFN